MGFKYYLYTVTVLVMHILHSVSCRTTVDQIVQTEDEKQRTEQIHLHVITKREAMNDLEQTYPRVEGRTFRASEPLDPNSQGEDSPQNIFDSFDTVNEIFQPEVSGETSESGNDQTGDEQRVSETASVTGSDLTSPNNTDARQSDVTSQDGRNNVQNDVSGVRQTVGSEYPDSSRVHTSSHSQTDYRDTSRSQYQAPSYTYPSSSTSGHDSSSTSRRVVVAGSGPGTGTNYQGTPVYRGSSSYSGQTGEIRGARYDGPRYVDSSGHYVDAQGRHLDSTGQYYDISGRYQDAIMSRTVIHSGSSGGSNPTYYTDTRPGYSSGTSSGYYDNDRREYGSRGGYLDSTGRYVEGSRLMEPSRSRPVNSYGGNQFYSGGNTYQTTYNPVTSQISSDTTCANTNDRLTVYINDLHCADAITQLGRFVCYNYERVSLDCCQRCLSVKQPEQEGCEYGDRSSQCEAIQPSDCYNERNRQICCSRCRSYRTQMSPLNLPDSCMYGDMSNQCQNVAQRNHLCYLPENQRVCCSTCPRYADQNHPGCQWGNKSPEFCSPFDSQGRVRINCYRYEVNDICCSTCRSLRDRMRDLAIPGCEYGDYPILFRVRQNGLTCSEYIRQYGVENCDEPDLARQCCYTCYRYRQVRG